MVNYKVLFECLNDINNLISDTNQRPTLRFRDAQVINEACGVNTQGMRTIALKALEMSLKQALEFSKCDEFKQKERAMWSNIVAYTSQVMALMLKSYDDQQIDENLGELKVLLEEAKARRKALLNESKTKSGIRETEDGVQSGLSDQDSDE